jgi:hypothetical protein
LFLNHFPNIFKVDTKVIEAAKRVKSLPVMKTTLEKLLADATAQGHPEVKVEAEPKKAEPKKAEKPKVAEAKVRPSDDDITGALTTFLEMIKARPDQVLEQRVTELNNGSM